MSEVEEFAARVDKVADMMIVDQPPPTPLPDREPGTVRNFYGTVPIQDLVIADIQERKRVGIERYGQPLLTFNGRNALVDLYQELLDAAQYIRQEIEERKSRGPRAMKCPNCGVVSHPTSTDSAGE